MKKKFRLFPEEFNNFPLYWLIYMIFPIYNIAKEETPKALLGYALVLLFVWIYRDSYWRPNKHLIHLIAQLLIVFFFCIFYHPMFIYMAFYPANLIGFLKSNIQLVVCIGLEVLMFAVIMVYHHISFSSILFVSIVAPFTIVLISPFAVRASKKYQDMQKELNHANKQIEELIKKEERQRIARDLHDTLGHTLSLITLKSEVVEKLIKRDPDKAIKEVKEIKETSRTTLKQVRELVSDMNMIKLTEEVAHARSILTAANINLTILGDMGILAGNTSKLNENILGMCLREAITNVVKHSKATECIVELTERLGKHELTIKDNGIGIANAKGQGNGLHGIYERLRLVEGTVSIGINGEMGTKLTISIPKVIKTHVETTA